MWVNLPCLESQNMQLYYLQDSLFATIPITVLGWSKKSFHISLRLHRTARIFQNLFQKVFRQLRIIVQRVHARVVLSDTVQILWLDKGSDTDSVDGDATFQHFACDLRWVTTISVSPGRKSDVESNCICVISTVRFCIALNLPMTTSRIFVDCPVLARAKKPQVVLYVQLFCTNTKLPVLTHIHQLPR